VSPSEVAVKDKKSLARQVSVKDKSKCQSKILHDSIPAGVKLGLRGVQEQSKAEGGGWVRQRTGGNRWGPLGLECAGRMAPCSG